MGRLKCRVGIPAHQNNIDVNGGQECPPYGENMSNYRRDFTKGGLYFFTVVLENRQSGLLVHHIVELREAFAETQQFYPFETVAICVLPDHFHILMQLPENDDNYSQRIQSIKHNFSKRLKMIYKNPNESKSKRREVGIWQRRFWEHLIKDDQDLANHWDYIYYNPVKHGYVSSVKDWAFSSFHRDVKNGIYPEDWGGNPNITIKGEM